MTGFNLPPGCSVNDIPGNRPEDIAEEAFWDILIGRVEAEGGSGLPAGWYDDKAIVALIEVVRDMEYAQGFGDGRDDAIMDMGARELEREANAE